MRFRSVAIASMVGAAGVVVVACVGDDPADTGPDSTNDGGTIDGASAQIDSGGPGPSPKEDSSVTTTDSGDAGAKRYCETAPKPLVGEFFCADFDGTQLSEGWTDSFKTDGGTLDFTTDVFLSGPHALVVKPAMGTGNGSGPLLRWKSSGGKKFVNAELVARFNPTSSGGLFNYTGDVKLLEITTDNALVALYLTAGGGLADDDFTPSYTGYYIKSAAFGGAAAQHDYKVTTVPKTSDWTDIKLAWEAGGQMVLSFNDVSVLSQKVFGSTSTSLTFTVGAASAGDVNDPRAFRFDNVEIKLAREP